MKIIHPAFPHVDKALDKFSRTFCRVIRLRDQLAEAELALERDRAALRQAQAEHPGEEAARQAHLADIHARHEATVGHVVLPQAPCRLSLGGRA